MNTLFRRMMLAAFAIIAMLITPHPSSAQIPPRICTPDCPGDAWQSVDNILYTTIHCGTSICQVRIHYALRRACEQQYWDFQVHEIDLLDPSCNANCTNAQILSEAIYELLMDNNTAVDQPKKGECITTWRVSIGACWKKTVITMPLLGPVTVLIPCEPGVCCLTRYYVCRDNFNTKTLYPQGPPPVDPMCSAEGESECFAACSDTWLNILGKQTIKHEQHEPVELLTFSANGPSSLVCNAVEHSAAHLEIIDMTGRVILTAETEPDADLHCRFSIDLRGLRAGTYLCRVVNAGRNVMQAPILATR